MSSPTDFTFIADALLALCDKPEDRPFYTEQALQRRFKEITCDSVIFLNVVAGDEDDVLFRREYEAVFEEAKLTERQRQVAGRKFQGLSFEQIGRALGISKQSAQSTFTQALRKLYRALKTYPYAGLSEIYRSETHRGSGRKAA